MVDPDGLVLQVSGLASYQAKAKSTNRKRKSKQMPARARPNWLRRAQAQQGACQPQEGPQSDLPIATQRPTPIARYRPGKAAWSLPH